MPKNSLRKRGARCDVLRQACEAMASEATIEQRIREATQTLSQARDALSQTELSESELTIQPRLQAATESRNALQSELKQLDDEYNQLIGSMRQSEGLHPKRAAAAAAVDKLSRATERKALHKQSLRPPLCPV